MHLNYLLLPHKFLQTCVAYASPHISQEQSLQGPGVQVGFLGPSAQGLTSVWAWPETHQGKGSLPALLCCGQDSSPGLLDRGPRCFTSCSLNSVSHLGIFPRFPIRSQLGANLQPQLHFHPPFPPTSSPSPLDLGKYKSKCATLGHAAFSPCLLCSEQRQHQGSHRCSLSTLVMPTSFSSLLHG